MFSGKAKESYWRLVLKNCAEFPINRARKAHQTEFLVGVSSDSNQESDKEKEKAEEIKIKGSLNCADC